MHLVENQELELELSKLDWNWIEKPGIGIENRDLN